MMKMQIFWAHKNINQHQKETKSERVVVRSIETERTRNGQKDETNENENEVAA